MLHSSLLGLFTAFLSRFLPHSTRLLMLASLSVCYEVNTYKASWHGLTPANREGGKTKLLLFFFLSLLTYKPTRHPPHVHCASRGWSERPHSVSGFTCPFSSFSPSSLTSHKVYLRLRLSCGGLDVNIQSTSSLNTPIQRDGQWKQLRREQFRLC